VRSRRPEGTRTLADYGGGRVGKSHDLKKNK